MSPPHACRLGLDGRDPVGIDQIPWPQGVGFLDGLGKFQCVDGGAYGFRVDIVLRGPFGDRRNPEFTTIHYTNAPICRYCPDMGALIGLRIVFAVLLVMMTPIITAIVRTSLRPGPYLPPPAAEYDENGRDSEYYGRNLAGRFWVAGGVGLPSGFDQPHNDGGEHHRHDSSCWGGNSSCGGSSSSSFRGVSGASRFRSPGAARFMPRPETELGASRCPNPGIESALAGERGPGRKRYGIRNPRKVTRLRARKPSRS